MPKSVARDAAGIFTVPAACRRAANTPTKVAAILADMAAFETEHLEVLALDGRHRVISRFTVGVGGANVVHVSPRDIFRKALSLNAVTVIIAHNHPSGDPTPSGDDCELTQRIRAAGDLIGVPMVDHMVIASEGHYSFAAGRVFLTPEAQAEKYKQRQEALAAAEVS